MINRFQGRWYFLSNFYECKIEHQGITYPSVEHYYVAMKSVNDQLIDGVYYTSGDLREFVSRLKSPGIAKRFGRKFKIRKDWRDVKLKIMDWGVREKFKDPKLIDLLLSTGDQKIIEGNLWHDNFWGSCLCDKCGDNGKNHLGKILMNIRKELNGNVGLSDVLNTNMN